MYLLEQGRVKLIRTSSDDRVQLLSIHAPGEVLGEIPVFDPHGGPRTASAVSMSHGTRVVWLEHDALFAWLDEHPRVAIDMLQVMASRQRGNNERISDLVFMDVPARLAKTLLNLGSRFGEPVEQGLKVPHDLTQEELAQLVGSSRETVNKALMDFSNRGWIARDGRSIIIFQRYADSTLAALTVRLTSSQCYASAILVMICSRELTVSPVGRHPFRMGPMPKKKSLTLQRVLVLLLAYIMLAVCGGVAASVLFVPGVIGANKAAKAVIPSLKVENVDFDVTICPRSRRCTRETVPPLSRRSTTKTVSSCR